jgi:hypothetical protein
MKSRLKEEFVNSIIYVPIMKSNILGKFIPEGVLDNMSQKYPELFERIADPDTNMFLEAVEEKEEFVKKKLDENEEID